MYLTEDEKNANCVQGFLKTPNFIKKPQKKHEFDQIIVNKTSIPSKGDRKKCEFYVKIAVKSELRQRPRKKREFRKKKKKPQKKQIFTKNPEKKLPKNLRENANFNKGLRYFVKNFVNTTLTRH